MKNIPSNRANLLAAFTILELLLVIAIVAIMFGGILFNLNPVERLEDAQNTKAIAKSSDLKKAIDAYMIANNGSLPVNIANLSSYGIHDICKQGQTNAGCINLDELITTGYLTEFPNDSKAATNVVTGYKIEYDPTKKGVQIFGNQLLSDYVIDGGTLTQGLVGYWKFDETSANTCTGGVNDSCDSSGNTNDGAWNGNATRGIGRYGSGVDVDGSGDFVSIADSVHVSPTSRFSVGGWVYRDSASTADAIVGKYVSGSNRRSYLLGFNTSVATFVVSPNGTSATVVNSTTTIAAGDWYHVMGVYDGANLEIYVNGKLEASTSYTGSIYDSTDVLRIGDGDQGYWYLDGKIDDVRIYNRALDSNEVNALYSYAPPVLGHWKLDDASGTTAQSTNGNLIAGTLAGGTTWTTGKYLGAVNLDGVNDVVDTSFNNTLNFVGSSFTMAAWINTTQTSLGSFLMIRDNAGVAANVIGGFPINVTSGKVSFDTWDYAANRVTSTTTINNGQWYHVAGVYNVTTGTATLYINGIEEDSKLQSGMATNANRMLRMGANINTAAAVTQPYQGKVDDVRVYKYALTAQQIQAVMNNEI